VTLGRWTRELRAEDEPLMDIVDNVRLRSYDLFWDGRTALCAGNVATDRAEEMEDLRSPVGNSIAYPPGVVLILSGEPETLSVEFVGWSVITVRGASGVGLGTRLRYPCEWPLINGWGRIPSSRPEMECVDGGRVTDWRLDKDE
jgi:hypothetical protein